MYVDKDGHEWGEKTDTIESVHLFTNGTLMVFTDRGFQVPDYQKKKTRKVILELADKAKDFYIARWREWQEKISREEFLALNGVKLVPKKMKPLAPVAQRDRAR